jgi:hypothetical protein
VLRYLPNHQINYQLWDACVEQSAQRLVYALSWYLDVVAPGWAGLVAEQEGVYGAVMPLPVSHKFSIPYLRQPLFCQQLGIFHLDKELNAEAFLREVERHFSLISQYSFNTPNTQNISFEENRNLTVNQNFTHHLDLNRDYESIFQGYSRDRKLNLKRSQKAGLKIILSTDIEPLISLFKADAASRIKGGVAPAAYEQLKQLYAALAQRGLATLLYTQTPAGETDAGGLFVTYGNKIIYLFNAASVAGRRRNGRSLIIDHIIQQYAGQDYIFDFESPATVKAIIRVYAGFGAEAVPYLTINYNRLPAPLKVVKKVRQFLYQKVISTFKAKPKL